MTRYLLDANVFIQAKNIRYGFDFRPAFQRMAFYAEWHRKSREHREGRRQSRPTAPISGCLAPALASQRLMAAPAGLLH